MDAIEHCTDTLEGIYAGRLGTLPNGRASAIDKRPLTGRVEVGRLGLIGDTQADRDNHGGPERALLHYCRRHYADWAHQFPSAEARCVAPGFGENLSSASLDEASVFIGDLYRIGTLLVQVAQPRSPCWKLDQRFGVAGLAKQVQDTQRCGWLYRVIEPGHIQTGDCIRLEERPYSGFSIAQVMRAVYAEQTDIDLLQRLTRLGPLSLNWRSKAQRRLDGTLSHQGARLQGG